MQRDFTLSKYTTILTSILSSDYKVIAVLDWIENTCAYEDRTIIIRHDVDRRPGNALAMAHIESRLGIRSTYYFRTVGSAFNEEIISTIADYGHEIGYHYEDFFVARYNPENALNLFRRNLGKLRKLAPIKTIAMHGSPLSRFSNMELWKHFDFNDFGVSDCILSVDWSQFAFFTDTGRRFDASVTNLRDEIGGQRFEGVRNSSDLVRFLTERRPHYAQISIHPERWNENLFTWSTQWTTDMIANTIKVGLRTLRS
ncbi:MAG: hypothetical protein EWM45_16775 [Rhodopseudomonas palustris]|nr:MAG: hypothetical protein EWM45_16775 [Rhodopseudomonas palustris]